MPPPAGVAIVALARHQTLPYLLEFEPLAEQRDAVKSHHSPEHLLAAQLGIANALRWEARERGREGEGRGDEGTGRGSAKGARTKQGLHSFAAGVFYSRNLRISSE